MITSENPDHADSEHLKAEPATIDPAPLETSSITSDHSADIAEMISLSSSLRPIGFYNVTRALVRDYAPYVGAVLVITSTIAFINKSGDLPGASYVIFSSESEALGDLRRYVELSPVNSDVADLPPAAFPSFISNLLDIARTMEEASEKGGDTLS